MRQATSVLKNARNNSPLSRVNTMDIDVLLGSTVQLDLMKSSLVQKAHTLLTTALRPLNSAILVITTLTAF